MDVVSAFLIRNIVYVYFFYGLAFFSLGLVVLLESGRATEFRFARALLPLALFGFVHGAHEWFEMFQIFAAHATGYTAGLAEELFRVISLTVSFVFLLAFGARLLPDAEARPRASYGQVAAMIGVWLAATLFVYLRQRPTLDDLVVAADVLSRYILGITGALLASWALLRERRDFHKRGMSAYGQALLWAALAFFVYGVIGQFFVRPSIVAPSQVINTALFVRTFGFPVQLLRGAAAVAIAIMLGSALRAFDAEGRLRLARAHKARIEAQAATLEAQARRTQEVEALNVQLRGTTHELSALVEMSRTLSSTIEWDRVLHYALYQIAHSFAGVWSTAIFLKQSGMAEPAQTYQPPQASGFHQPPAAALLLSAVAGRVMDSSQAVGVDLAGEIVIVEDADADGNVAIQKSSGPYRTLGVPLVAQGESVGSLVMSLAEADGPNRRPFTRQDLNLLAAFARQITTSIENARLYQALQEREARLAELFRQLVNAQEGERQRIARELHDETGQKLSALAMGLAAVEASDFSRMDGDGPAAGRSLIHNLREVTDQAITELRHIMSDLRPALLDDLGLAPALRSYVQQYALRHPEISVALSADRGLKSSARRLPPEYETALFRVAQEALTNVARHAHATHVTVTFEQRPEVVRLEISDNGVGFSPDAARAPSQAPGAGLGLVGMRERVTLVGGRWSVQSAPGAGTCVVVELPLR
jgi:signal transduction histidine kinase